MTNKEQSRSMTAQEYSERVREAEARLTAIQNELGLILLPVIHKVEDGQGNIIQTSLQMIWQPNQLSPPAST